MLCWYHSPQISVNESFNVCFFKGVEGGAVSECVGSHVLKQQPGADLERRQGSQWHDAVQRAARRTPQRAKLGLLVAWLEKERGMISKKCRRARG